MARRIEEAALDFCDSLIRATKIRDKQEALKEADCGLERLKTYSRLCRELKLHSFGQYEYLAGHLDELRRLLGGWQKRASEKRIPSEGFGPFAFSRLFHKRAIAR